MGDNPYCQPMPATATIEVELDANALGKALQMAREHDAGWLKLTDPDSHGGVVLDLYHSRDAATFIGRWKLTSDLFDYKAELLQLAGRPVDEDDDDREEMFATR